MQPLLFSVPELCSLKTLGPNSQRMFLFYHLVFQILRPMAAKYYRGLESEGCPLQANRERGL